MIKTLLLPALIIPICLQSQIKKKVLFIGNSYTYVNSLPQLIYDLAITKQDTLFFDHWLRGALPLITIVPIHKPGRKYVL